eukprot:INCI9395.1.p1 GENE.INCI9395.1~~INCI9395.1.p1  ORF type:complete len:424 (-),score=79.33 INCI9395.1:440-1711(-)
MASAQVAVVPMTAVCAKTKEQLVAVGAKIKNTVSKENLAVVGAKIKRAAGKFLKGLKQACIWVAERAKKVLNAIAAFVAKHAAALAPVIAVLAIVAVVWPPMAIVVAVLKVSLGLLVMWTHRSAEMVRPTMNFVHRMIENPGNWQRHLRDLASELEEAATKESQQFVIVQIVIIVLSGSLFLGSIIVDRSLSDVALLAAWAGVMYSRPSVRTFVLSICVLRGIMPFLALQRLSFEPSFFSLLLDAWLLVAVTVEVNVHKLTLRREHRAFIKGMVICPLLYFNMATGAATLRRFSFAILLWALRALQETPDLLLLYTRWVEKQVQKPLPPPVSITDVTYYAVRYGSTVAKLLKEGVVPTASMLMVVVVAKIVLCTNFHRDPASVFKTRVEIIQYCFDHISINVNEQDSNGETKEQDSNGETKDQ